MPVIARFSPGKRAGTPGGQVGARRAPGGRARTPRLGRALGAGLAIVVLAATVSAQETPSPQPTTQPARVPETEPGQTAPQAVPIESSPGESTPVADTVTGVDSPAVVAQFTTGVENREPIDQVTFVENDARNIFFFTELRGLEGETVLHRWIYDGEVRAEVRFEVGGPRWRVWSSKELVPDWIGDWTVEIVLGSGEVIAAESFTYSAPNA